MSALASRTFLDPEARKPKRKFLGPVGGAAIKLDADGDVTSGLHIGEGVETCMAARQLGLKPVWVLGSAGAIGRFPLLNGIDALTVLAENDEANAVAVAQVGERWTAAGREVLIVRSVVDSDMNDALKRRATA
jgi:putative DNA primase/helicase